jgi:ribosome-associated translation inhibitor RaiA
LLPANLAEGLTSVNPSIADNPIGYPDLLRFEKHVRKARILRLEVTRRGRIIKQVNERRESMNIQVETQGIELTPALKAHIHRQLHFNFANFEGHIVSVDVFLRDINGPKGGFDKKALVCIQLASRTSIKVERTRSDAFAAVTLVGRQAKRAVKRALHKTRRMEKLALRHLRQFPQI